MVEQYILWSYLLLKTLLVDVLWPRSSRTLADTVLNIYIYVYVYIYMPSVGNSKIVIDGHLGPPLMQSFVLLICLFPIFVPYSRIPVNKRVSMLTSNPCTTLSRPHCLQGF